MYPSHVVIFLSKNKHCSIQLCGLGEALPLCLEHKPLAVIEFLIRPDIISRLPKPWNDILVDSAVKSVLGSFNEGELDGVKHLSRQPIRGFKSRSRFLYREISNRKWFLGLYNYLSEADRQHVAVAIVKMAAAAYARSYSLYAAMDGSYCNPLTVDGVIIVDMVA